MKKKCFGMIPALLAAVMLLAGGAGAESIADAAAGIAAGELFAEAEGISMLPEDYSGFRMEACADFAALVSSMSAGVPEADSSGKLISASLPESAARLLFEAAEPLSIGPDGAVFWLSRMNGISVPFIQRGKTLVPLAQAVGRGVPDADGSLRALLDQKRTGGPFLEGSVRWSPDGRYLFLNEPARWIGKLEADDVYLTDSRTGEIFLVDSAETLAAPAGSDEGFPEMYPLSGAFSADSGDFYYVCEIRPSLNERRIHLMRYAPDSGKPEKCCELSGTILDMIETDPGHWFLLRRDVGSPGNKVIRMTVTENGDGSARYDIAEDEWATLTGECRFLPASGDRVLLMCRPARINAAYFLPLSFGEADAPHRWYKIQGLYSPAMTEVSMDDITNEQMALVGNSDYEASYTYIDRLIPDTADVQGAAAIRGTPYLLLSMSQFHPVSDSWDGLRSVYFTGSAMYWGLAVLNTETMQIRLLPEVNPWVVTQGTSVLEMIDSVIGGDVFLARNGEYPAAYVLRTGNVTDPEKRVAAIRTGDEIGMPFGTFACVQEQDPLILSPGVPGFPLTLENKDVSARVTVTEEGIRMECTAAEYPAAEEAAAACLVPEVLTEERYNAILSSMTSKDRRKLNAYRKVSPDDLPSMADGEELLDSYPALANETLYILTGNSQTLKATEELLRRYGYTEEDYERDAEYVAKPRETNIIKEKRAPDKRYQVTYRFLPGETGEDFPALQAMELAGLCDRACSGLAEAGEDWQRRIPDIWAPGDTAYTVTLEGFGEKKGETENTRTVILNVTVK